MIVWLTALWLRWKLVLLAVGGALATIGYLYLRWRLAASKAASATAEAERLQAVQALEQRIAERRATLAERQSKIRAQINDDNRDWFSGGWGP